MLFFIKSILYNNGGFMKRGPIHKVVEISPETHDRLKEYCENNGLKICCFVSKIINDYLDQEEK